MRDKETEKGVISNTSSSGLKCIKAFSMESIGNLQIPEIKFLVGSLCWLPCCLLIQAHLVSLKALKNHFPCL